MLLQIRGRMTARELSGSLEVSVRTSYRDIDSSAPLGYRSRPTGDRRRLLGVVLKAGAGPAR
jgi:predicted DNA-binding transcriptional regulator YafY